MNLHSRLSPKCVKIARPTLFGYIETREEFEFYVNELFKLLKSRQLKLKIHKVYPLEEAAQAQRVRPATPLSPLVSWPYIPVADSICFLILGPRRSENDWKAAPEAII